ncbi:BZ3500_MvSof-1268-A1-R1_Chr3-3g06389 [Microbotryum saponariae]|uniref:Pre-mRNA-splicing factor 18 n=1 Tax=Microbotryum saponariae TaxID=289078 RepID=A0A2X0NFZ6_9BASI|nr:BZ3500_MvSof-1268-A1-R1_Chr3-3g06389 [Microbotryum saponariae]SDA04356.1 BZ3501_MvSof-1269-A2-R1_Chr3-2g06076 [Microbotryum saponariae]
MNFLKAEIANKKRALELANSPPTTNDSTSTTTDPSTASTSTSTTQATKYMRRGDLERIRVEQQQRQDLLYAALKVAQLEADSNQTLAVASSSSTTTTTTTEHLSPLTEVTDSRPEAFNISNEEAIKRLRYKAQPIRLFGESDKERRLRLRALELIEERSEGQRNEFMNVMHNVDKDMNLQQVADKISSSTTKIDKNPTTTTVGDEDGPLPEGENRTDNVLHPKDQDIIVDVSLVKSNPHKVYPQIYHALKRVLKEWEQSLADRPEAVRRSTQGRMAAATQQTSAEYLKPLFKSLRKRVSRSNEPKPTHDQVTHSVSSPSQDLAPDVLQAIAEITYNMQIREYLRANDAYLRLSIGNAPWPIGVTMVGIHERSGREKIFSNNVAHVLNDETSRKYIQSLKRLLTFAQTVRPPSDLSQIMG